VSSIKRPIGRTDSQAAAAFYNIHPILIPYGSPTDGIIQNLRKAQPDSLIAEAGTLEIPSVLSACKTLSNVVWVTKPGNEHMDFAAVPEDVGKKVNVATWHDLVEERKSPGHAEVPSVEKGSADPSLSIVEPDGIVEYRSEVHHMLLKSFAG
jgi:hypothetical protein